MYQVDENEVGEFKGLKNALGRKGMKKSGVYPFDRDWVEHNPGVFKISDAVYATSAGSKNAELATLAIAENVDSLGGVNTLLVAKKFISHSKFRDVLKMMAETTNLAVGDLENMFLRVSTGDFTESCLDQICAVPWWDVTLKKFKEFKGPKNDGDNFDEEVIEAEGMQQKSSTYSNKLTAWNELKNAALDLNTPTRLEQLRLHKEQKVSYDYIRLKRYICLYMCAYVCLLIYICIEIMYRNYVIYILLHTEIHIYMI
jgi:hypothetical protein